MGNNMKEIDPLGNPIIKIPFFIPDIKNIEKNSVLKTLNSKLLTNGPNLVRFENEFKKFTNSKFSSGVSNATSALHIALIANGIGKNDEVIIPDITFIATANTVIMSGATPVLADVNINDFNIDVESIKKNITKKTKAIIPVHFAGNPCNMKNIVQISKKYNLKIIEDCAHAIGTFYNGKHVGNFGNSGCFSFYPTKNITTLEGGMIITNEKKISDKIRVLRNHGITKTLRERYHSEFPWEYDVKIPGYNYRIDEARAILGFKQIKRINKINYKRKKIVENYLKRLKNIDGIEFQEIDNKNISSNHLFVIRIVEKRFGMNRNTVYKKLQKMGIQTSVHYKPLHMFSIFKKFKNRNLKNSKILFNEILSLPIYNNMSSKHQEIVISSLKSLKQ